MNGGGSTTTAGALPPALLLSLACLLGSGCEARFSYQPLAGGADLTASDPRPAPEPADLSGADLAEAADQELGRGTFMDRAGHLGQGTARLVRRGTGGLELVFDADFRVSGVPRPFVFLTTRADMGTHIDTAADFEVARLQALSGAQRYPLPPEDFSARRYVFVFCKPFSVEVALAVLEPAR